MVSCSNPSVARMNVTTPFPSYACISLTFVHWVLPRRSGVGAHLVERRAALAKMRLCRVNIIGHDICNSYVA